MDSLEIEALYKSVIDCFGEVDHWVFQQGACDDADFLVARETKIRPMVEGALQALARVAPFCKPDNSAGGIAFGADERIKSILAAESWIAAFLKGPTKAEQLEELAKQFWIAGNYCVANRIYRYLTWRNTLSSATKTPQENGISAVLRVKNEAVNLRAILPFLLAYFDEVVVVDHNSTDDTYAYVESLKSQKIKLARYSAVTARAGEFYESERRSGKGSLADYYNFAFAQATCAYVCKWDADMYPLLTLKPLLKSIRANRPDIVKIGGMDCFGYLSCTHEERIYKKSLNLRYVDKSCFEALEIPQGIKIERIQEPVYLHMKRDPLLAEADLVWARDPLHTRGQEMAKAVAKA